MPLFPEEHASMLKAWIVKRLEGTKHDVDVDILSEYILALLRQDQDATLAQVREHVESEIREYLAADASAFTNDVFNAVHGKAYMPGGRLSPLTTPVPRLAGLTYGDGLTAPNPTDRFSQNGSKKRALEAHAGGEVQQGREARFAGDRHSKQPRRGSQFRAGRADYATNNRGPGVGANIAFGSDQPSLLGHGLEQFPLGGAQPLEPFDLNKFMGGIFGMGAIGVNPPPGISLPRGGRASSRGRRRCRDYDNKGVCARGVNCMFEHSNDPMYPAISNRFPALPQPPLPQDEEYDPTNALLTDVGYGTQASSQAIPAILPDPSPNMIAAGVGKQSNGSRRGRPRAPFSSDRPNYDRSKSTIVVENIPEEHFSQEDVREFFSQFGNVVDISMQPYKHLAVVKFDTYTSALAAYRSPKVVFENRFVKVYWYKDEQTSLPPSKPSGDGVVNGRSKHKSATGGSPIKAKSEPPASEINLEEFRRKQAVAQEAHLEKVEKLAAVEREQQELEKKRKELEAKRAEERAKLEAKLAQKVGSGTSGNAAEGGDTTASSRPTLQTRQTEALRAQLALLEAEAASLGINPNAVEEDMAVSWNPRAAYGRGRGRGGYRARGYPPHARAGYRPGMNDNTYAAYSLDLRPKKVTITGVDFTVSEKDETLRQYLLGIGEFTDVQTSSTSTDITFRDRKTAEKFVNGLLLNNREIPGVEGQVEPAWSGTAGSVPMPIRFSAPPIASDSRAPGSTDRPQPQQRPQQQQQQQQASDEATRPAIDQDVSIVLDNQQADQNEMDYDVADDNQWDIG